jgi:hypothetical protein
VAKQELINRLIGLVILMLGLALLGITFSLAHQMFLSDTVGVAIDTSKQASKSATSLFAVAAIQLFARIGLLLIMSIVGSIVASKGIALMFSVANPRTEPHD